MSEQRSGADKDKQERSEVEADSQIGRSALPGQLQANGSVNPVRVTRIAKQPLAPARLSRHWPGGMIYREVRVGASAVIALAGLMGLAALMIVMQDRFLWFSGDLLLFPDKILPDIWRIAILIVFFLMGIICGAEEAENGAENFVLRLPITRLQIYLEKTAGSLLGIAVWFAFSFPLVYVICRFGFAHVFQLQEMIAGKDLAAVLASGVFLYFCGQAAGAWTGRVIFGSILGGVVGVAILWTVQFLNDQNIQIAMSHAPAVIMTIAIICAWAAAITRFLTREGR